MPWYDFFVCCKEKKNEKDSIQPKPEANFQSSSSIKNFSEPQFVQSLDVKRTPALARLYSTLDDQYESKQFFRNGVPILELPSFPERLQRLELMSRKDSLANPSPGLSLS